MRKRSRWWRRKEQGRVGRLVQMAAIEEPVWVLTRCQHADRNADGGDELPEVRGELTWCKKKEGRWSARDCAIKHWCRAAKRAELNASGALGRRDVLTSSVEFPQSGDHYTFCDALCRTTTSRGDGTSSVSHPHSIRNSFNSSGCF